ncbi:WG repeat-containing protein [uncultured Fibrella sp.]|uniref:WG repeat-containing protein n=1 Tax=uncultured Fibrella sp. TaxID=1284596 RepID=UPI0035CAB2C8
MEQKTNLRGWVHWTALWCVGLLAWLIPPVSFAQSPAEIAQLRKTRQQAPALVVVTTPEFRPTGVAKPKSWRDLYSYVSSFSGELAYAERNSKYGFVNRNGQEVIPCVWEAALLFAKDLFAVKQNGKWGCINQQGQEVTPFLYQSIGTFSEGLIEVKRNGRWGYLNEKAQEVIPCTYDYTTGFSNGMATVRRNGLIFRINLKGVCVEGCLSRR